jgi:hypothetical protein
MLEHLLARQSLLRTRRRSDRVREARDQVEARLHLDRLAQRLFGDAGRACARRVDRREKVQRPAQRLVDRRRLVVGQDRVDQIGVVEGGRRDRAVGFRSERALPARRHEGGKELALARRPLGRPSHHELQQLAERAADQLAAVLQRLADVRAVDARLRR